MRVTSSDNKWSPFDPEWYKYAFDKHTSIDDELFAQDEIIKAGYILPDSDGSKSSVFHREDTLNNSFNESALRETLEQIYLNNTHRLAAANHDNVHFFKWNGTFSEVTFLPNTDLCELTLETDAVINQGDRNNFKLSQYYHRWFDITEIMRNWDVFKFNILLFINRRIYSEYEIFIDEQQTKIRFRYFSHWVSGNYPIYIYKFDTLNQARVGITKELIVNQFNWQLPIEYIEDKKFKNLDKVVIAINRINDSSIRNDGADVDVLGDNLEFLPVVGGFIDLSKMSEFNKQLILCEPSEWLWMSIFVPKYFHEYPILLPVDVIYRRYQSNFVPVRVTTDGERKSVKASYSDFEDHRNVYIDLYDQEDTTGSWKQIIRPIVFSDAFLDEDNTPYTNIMDDINNIKDLSISCADVIESFRLFMSAYTTDEEFLRRCDELQESVDALYSAYTGFRTARTMEPDTEYEALYQSFLVVMETIREDKNKSTWFKKSRNKNNFWTFISPLVYIPRNLTDKYYINTILEHIKEPNIWEDRSKYLSMRRFNFPIDVTDFWTFEYDMEKNVWRPYFLDVEGHFPDVYTLAPLDNSLPEENKVYKAFFFYTDMMNINNKAVDIIDPTRSWDVDTQNFVKKGAIYRDIFMEKFYWMAIHAIYKGILNTQYRWELIEYVIDNSSYERFNKLFLNTMDPYFKMGLANYIHSDNYQFPTDYKLEKMNESIATKFLGYQSVTNYEMYLNNTWVESYFDYVITLLDDWKDDDKLVLRPRPSFDINRVLAVLEDITSKANNRITEINTMIDDALHQMGDDDYHIDTGVIQEMREVSDAIAKISDDILNKIRNLDINIYSIDDINEIIEMLREYKVDVRKIYSYLVIIHEQVESISDCDEKLQILDNISTYITDNMVDTMHTIEEHSKFFDITGFMDAVNNPKYFDNPTSPDNDSLIGIINQFKYPWPTSVKNARDKLFKSSVLLYNTYDASVPYEVADIENMLALVIGVNDDVVDLKNKIDAFINQKGLTPDDDIINRVDYAITELADFRESLNYFIEGQSIIKDACNELNELIRSLRNYNLSDKEDELIDEMCAHATEVLEACKYVDGSHIPDAIDIIETEYPDDIVEMTDIIHREESIYDSIADATVIDEEIEEITDKDINIIDAVIDYMETVNDPFIPDKEWPTYCDIYGINEIEIVSRGFNNQVGDTLFVEGVGIYEVDSIVGEARAVDTIHLIEARNTSFRDPKAQSLNPYDSISSGDGIGFSVRVISSNRSSVINDTPVSNYLEKIEKILDLILLNKNYINPYYNYALEENIVRINKIQSDWEALKEKYVIYMSGYTVNAMDTLVDEFVGLTTPIHDLNQARLVNDYGALLNRYDNFINLSYQVFAEAQLLTPDYLYFNQRMKDAYDQANEYYGSGTGWNDPDEEIAQLNNIAYELELFHRKMMGVVHSDELTAEYDYLMDYIDNIGTTIDNIYVAADELVEYVENVEETKSHVDNLQVDHWYSIDSVLVGVGGEGYRVGDIIRIIPQLPLDPYGRPIHDQEELIMNDKIFVQVTAVTAMGEVISVETLMNYALPYPITGSRETEAIFGNGNGLILNFLSIEPQLKDSPIFIDEGSDQKHLPQYAKNDLFKFDFENNHELDIQYEVFMGGRQLTDFIIRHTPVGDSKIKSIDSIYLNANTLMELKDSSIYIEGENYFIYRITNIDIVDPGAGYTLGQTIIVKTDQVPLKLTVTELDGTPYHGIGAVEISELNGSFNGTDPIGTNVPAIPDSMNNIDDEYHSSYYDELPAEGIAKPATILYPQSEFEFISKRFDDLDGKNRNKTWLYPEIDSEYGGGDPDEGYYLGQRAGDSHFYDGVMPPIPPGVPSKSEFQSIERILIHKSDHSKYPGDMYVDTYDQIPRRLNDWPTGAPGKILIVGNDSTHGGHRVAYTFRSFSVTGYILYDTGEIDDLVWNKFDIDWNEANYYPDMPTLKAQYPSELWRTENSYQQIITDIQDGVIERKFTPVAYTGTYIHNVTTDDLSVYNHTTKQWEDLSDTSRWRLEVRSDDVNKDWGFSLECLEDNLYEYDMELFLNKTADNQVRNSSIKRNAVFTISTDIKTEVDTKSVNRSVNTGRQLRIRKVFPYEQTETFIVNNDNKEMDFTLTNYNHFKNEIHAEDIVLYNVTAGRFEQLLGSQMFELQIRDDNAVQRGRETQFQMNTITVIATGAGYYTGYVWGYNEENNSQIFGYCYADLLMNGPMMEFIPLHCSKYPEGNTMLEYILFQSNTQNMSDAAHIIVEFKKTTLDVYGDGWLPEVQNPLAPIPKEFKIICKYDIEGGMEYKVMISKKSETFVFVKEESEVNPIFHLDNMWIPEDRLYIVTERGRYPLINPSTGKPTIDVSYVDDGMDIMFVGNYNKYERLEIHTSSYPMRSVYTQRKVSSNGYIDLEGKINKPLNKKYFEFWMNGKLLSDEVTIITPTKIFLHGLTALRNFEIVEINRNYHEYFGDNFLDMVIPEYSRPYPIWNLTTYLDDALSGTLEGENYTVEEQEYLLTPVWHQVDVDNPEYKNYPENQDMDADILLGADTSASSGSAAISYRHSIVNYPTIEGTQIVGDSLKFSDFGFVPISNSDIIDMINVEWAQEIEDGEIDTYTLIANDRWYGYGTKMYDEYGLLVHTLNDAAYIVADDNVVVISTDTGISTIIQHKQTYDLD